MSALNVQGAANIKDWSTYAHTFKVIEKQYCIPVPKPAMNNKRALFLNLSFADLALKVFMATATSDGCSFAAVSPRRAEVAAAVCNAVQLLSSWQPSLLVRMRLLVMSLPHVNAGARMAGRCSVRRQVNIYI
jgi:hypothetical protein